MLQDRFAAADAARAEFVTPDVEDVEGDFRAATDDAEQILRWDTHILEDELRGAGHPNAHFVLFLASADAIKAALHDEGAELVAFRCGDLGEDGVEVCDAAV